MLLFLHQMKAMLLKHLAAEIHYQNAEANLESAKSEHEEIAAHQEYAGKRFVIQTDKIVPAQMLARTQVLARPTRQVHRLEYTRQQSQAAATENKIV